VGCDLHQPLRLDLGHLHRTSNQPSLFALITREGGGVLLVIEGITGGGVL
jgi:hypothetical protein